TSDLFVMLSLPEIPESLSARRSGSEGAGKVTLVVAEAVLLARSGSPVSLVAVTLKPIEPTVDCATDTTRWKVEAPTASNQPGAKPQARTSEPEQAKRLSIETKLTPEASVAAKRGLAAAAGPSLTSTIV